MVSGTCSPAGLPAPWQEIVCPVTGATHYRNAANGVTRFDRPEGEEEEEGEGEGEGKGKGEGEGEGEEYETGEDEKEEESEEEDNEEEEEEEEDEEDTEDTEEGAVEGSLGDYNAGTEEEDHEEVLEAAAEEDEEGKDGVKLLAAKKAKLAKAGGYFKGLGSTLFHFPGQLEPCLTHKDTLNTPNTPLTRATQPLRAPPIPYKALKLCLKVNECKPLGSFRTGTRPTLNRRSVSARSYYNPPDRRNQVM